jgi:hypothetical protein
VLDAPNFTLAEENDEPFQVLLDSPYLSIIRGDGVYVCQVHLPWDLGDLNFELGRVGFIAEDAYSEGGVLELELRKLGDVPLGTDHHHNNEPASAVLAMNKELIYA